MSARKEKREPGSEVYGTLAVARFVGITEEGVQHLTEADAIPTYRVGTMICGNKEKLRAYKDGLARARAT